MAEGLMELLRLPADNIKKGQLCRRTGLDFFTREND